MSLSCLCIVKSSTCYQFLSSLITMIITSRQHPVFKWREKEKQRKQRGERKVTWTGGTPQADDLWTQKLILLLAGGNQKKTNELKIEPRHSHGLQKYFYGITLWYRLCGCVCICTWKSELVWSFFFWVFLFCNAKNMMNQMDIYETYTWL